MKYHWKVCLGLLFAGMAVVAMAELQMQWMYAGIKSRHPEVFEGRGFRFLPPSLWYETRALLGISNRRYIDAASHLQLQDGPTVLAARKTSYLVYLYFSAHEIDSLLRE